MSKPDATQASAVDAGTQPEEAATFAAAAAKLRTDLDRLLHAEAAPEVADQAVHDLMVTATKLLFAKREAGQDVMPFDEPELTATEVMVTASSMLKAANLEVFELTMWNGFSTL